jgi:hypothetical protein
MVHASVQKEKQVQNAIKIVCLNIMGKIVRISVCAKMVPLVTLSRAHAFARMDSMDQIAKTFVQKDLTARIAITFVIAIHIYHAIT